MSNLTKIKICGITDPKLAAQAVNAGADYIGIMCYTQSSRYVNTRVAKTIADQVKQAGGTPVLVVVEQDALAILDLAQTLGVYTIQLHGDVCRQTHQQLPDYFSRIYVRHFTYQGKLVADNDQGQQFLDPQRDFLLFDSEQGGSGQRYPLDAPSFKTDYRSFIAGGLNTNNVKDVIKQIHPYAVDVSSGVEAQPGKKNIQLIQQFITSVKSC